MKKNDETIHLTYEECREAIHELYKEKANVLEVIYMWVFLGKISQETFVKVTRDFWRQR